MRMFGILFRNGYLQTWGLSVRSQNIPLIGPQLYNALRWTCGKLTGHHVSKTEWGYGGGGYADVWCRWCNQIGQIPLSDGPDRFKNMRSTIWKFTGCDITKTIPSESSKWSPLIQPDESGMGDG